MDMDLNWVDHAYVLGVCCMLIAVSVTRPDLSGILWTTRQKIAFYYSNSVLLWGLAAIAVGCWVAVRPLAEMGFRLPRTDTFAQSLVLVAVTIFLFAADWTRQMLPGQIAQARRDWHRFTPFLPQTAAEVAHGMVVAASAGVCEEIIFRGYLVSYVQALLADSSLATPMAVILPSIVFGAIHGYQGIEGIVKITLLAVMLSLVFLSSGSLLYVILLHFAIDVVAMVSSPWLSRLPEQDHEHGD